MDNFIKPEEVLRQIQIDKGAIVADFGAGNGYFTTILAKQVGPEGKVYAIDVQKSVLEALRSKFKILGIYNTEFIWGDLEKSGGSKISNETVDFVLASNVVFQIQDKAEFFKEVVRVLKKGGVLLVIDWKPEAVAIGNFGPSLNQRIAKNKIMDMVSAAGLKFLNEISAGAYHYGLLFQKISGA